MTSIDHFDPFNNRLCRTVRNALAEAFKSAIKEGDRRPVEDVARTFLNEDPPEYVCGYIHQRLAAYLTVLRELEESGATGPVATALVIWDRRLFFETHEFLEPYWMAAAGDEKRLLQALIRAAGTYVHLEQGHLAAAERIAGKAVAGLSLGARHLAAYTDPRRLITALKALDPVPPVLSKAAGSTRSSA